MNFEKELRDIEYKFSEFSDKAKKYIFELNQKVKCKDDIISNLRQELSVITNRNKELEATIKSMNNKASAIKQNTSVVKQNRPSIKQNPNIDAVTVLTQSNKICPICMKRCTFKSCNVAYYSKTDVLLGYTAKVLLYCNKCSKYYIEPSTVKEILGGLNRTKLPGDEVKLHTRLRTHRTKENKTKEIIKVKTPANTSQAVDSVIKWIDSSKNGVNKAKQPRLNDSSFLKELGYDTTKNDKERWDILINKAIPKYGVKKVTRFIAYLIKGKVSQKNGADKYSHAISIWKRDLYKIRNL